MKTYITKINGMWAGSIAQDIQAMSADIAHQLGFREMGIYYYNTNGESVQTRSARFDGIIAGLSAGDVVVCQFPTWNGLKFERALAERIKTYRGRIIIFVHDMQALMVEGNRFMVRETVELYNQAEVLIVPSLSMQIFLLENGIREDMKFVVQELWDARRDGVISLESCCQTSTGGKFGTVWYENQDSYQYMHYNTPFLLSQYLVAEIPVIVPKGISCEETIEKNHLGLVVDSLEEAEERVKNMSEREYQGYLQAVKEFSTVLQNGYYTKQCLINAIKILYSKTIKENSVKERVYQLKDQKFMVAESFRSYGDAIALSWEFKGECDGFLVYNLEGDLLYETNKNFQHYLSMKRYEKESSFIIKAYVNTLKGRLITVEAETVYKKKREYKAPKVSLIIPAYNSGKYIARSIDMGLGQSLTDLELILVDDGSTDETPLIIDWYASQYTNVISIHKKNGGVASARNAGIENAGGKYIAFMDSDDRMRPDMLEQMYAAAEKNECDITVSSTCRITEYGSEAGIRYLIPKNEAMEADTFMAVYIEKGFGVPYCWNKLYRSSIVKNHPFPEIVFEDEAWTPYILSFAEKVCYVDTLGYEYDRQIRQKTLVNEWTRQEPLQVFENHKRAIYFYLENGNRWKKELLYRLAKKELSLFKRVLKCDKYAELLNEIEQMGF